MSQLSRLELQSVARELGLSTSGTKEQILSRIEKSAPKLKKSLTPRVSEKRVTIKTPSPKNEVSKKDDSKKDDSKNSRKTVGSIGTTVNIEQIKDATSFAYFFKDMVVNKEIKLVSKATGAGAKVLKALNKEDYSLAEDLVRNNSFNLSEIKQIAENYGKKLEAKNKEVQTSPTPDRIKADIGQNIIYAIVSLSVIALAASQGFLDPVFIGSTIAGTFAEFGAFFKSGIYMLATSKIVAYVLEQANKWNE